MFALGAMLDEQGDNMTNVMLVNGINVVKSVGCGNVGYVRDYGWGVIARCYRESS